MAEPQGPSSDYAGKLELTWTNKHLRLLAHKDGSYEWARLQQRTDT